jgi:phage terminase large subunit-like protein
MLTRNSVASHAVDFIGNLTLTGDFSGQPFALRLWQEGIIRRLFGTLNRHGKRVIRKSCWLLPRKKGKSQLTAACLIYCLCTFPSGQQIYSVARDLAPASEIFKMAVQMLRQDPELMEAFGIEIVESQIDDDCDGFASAGLRCIQTSVDHGLTAELASEVISAFDQQ